MRARTCTEKLLAAFGACVWIGSMVGCENSSSHGSPGRDSGAVSSGGVVGSGGGSGGTQTDAGVGTGGGPGGSGGTRAPDAETSSGGQGGGGTVGSGGVIGSGGKVATGGVVGSGGAIGSGGRTGSGGASATDAGSGGTCGTIAGVTCGPGQFCDLASKCGTISDAQGTCEATGPQVACTKEYRPVCGCNGISYDNDCLRQAAGALKLKEGLCGGPPDGSVGGQFGNGGSLGSGGVTGSGGAGGTTGTSAVPVYVGCFMIGGGLDHFRLEKRDYAQDQCIVLYLSAPSSNRVGYEVVLPTRWGLTSASISPCTGTGTAVTATKATGTISWGSGTSYPPDTANVDVVLNVSVLDGGSTFTYVFSAQNIDSMSGC
jgi:hypothetical protein